MQERLKIVMTTDTVSGIWAYCMDLCAALQQYDTEVHLVTMGALLNKDQYAQVQQLNNIYLYESNYKLEWMPDAWNDVEKAKTWIDSICEKVAPDILHFNNFGQADRKYRCPMVTVYHSCAETWWHAVKKEGIPGRWETYHEMMKSAISASDIIITPSEGIRREAESIFGPFDFSQLIHYGAQAKPFHDEKEPYILSVGQLDDEGKNIMQLCRIAPALPWPLYVIGHNNDKGYDFAADKVHLIKRSQGAMDECMSKASVFAMPAKYEPFGFEILEAAHAGCALVLGNIATLREIWGDAAIYVDTDDDADAMQAIERLVNDDSLRAEMALRAVSRAKQYTADTMAAEYIDLYKRLTE